MGLTASRSGSREKDEGSQAALTPPALVEEDWPWIWALRDPEVLDWKTGLTAEEIQARAKQQQDLPVSIWNEQLYLGNAACISNLTKLTERLGITAVLNMAGPMALKSNTVAALKRMGIAYKCIDAQDEPWYPLLERHWDEARDFLDANIVGSGKCVVHCVAGMNRSALIAAAYYMVTTQTNVLETVRHLRKQRGNVALQNDGFQEQLVSLARQHNLLGPPPGTQGSCVSAVSVPPVSSVNQFNDWRTQIHHEPNQKTAALDRLAAAADSGT